METKPSVDLVLEDIKAEINALVPSLIKTKQGSVYKYVRLKEIIEIIDKHINREAV